MKYICILLICLTTVMAMKKNNDELLFEKPLILGASVSRGFGTTDGGPGTVISKMIYSGAEITNKSRSGNSSLESTRDLDYFATNPSIVLALDLFFWDAAREQVGPSFEKNMRTLFKAYQDKKIPMIVGKVPVGVDFPSGIKEAGKKKSAKHINKLLEEICTEEKNCLLYDPKVCFDEMGGITGPGGVRYFSDSLHTTNEGNRFCAKIFVGSELYKTLKPVH